MDDENELLPWGEFHDLMEKVKSDENGKTKMVLSIDGGGIRGIIPAVILCDIESKVNAKLSEKNLDAKLKSSLGGRQWRFQDVFDIIAGTSTGAFIAAGLCKRDPVTPLEILSMYKDRGREIFPKSRLPTWPFFDAYNASGLEKVLKQSSRDSAGNELTLMDMGSKAQFVACSYDIYHQKPRIFASYWHTLPHMKKNSGFKSENFLLWQVCRASSAAPAFFKPYEHIGNSSKYLFIDGGLFANNPVLIAMNGLSDMSPSKSIGKAFVVSLGTGVAIDDRGAPTAGWPSYALDWLIKSLDLSMDLQSYSVHRSLNTYFKKSGFLSGYFRFQVNISKSHKMDDASVHNVQALEDLTRQYLERPRTIKKIEAVSNKIVEELEALL
jgi:patatin-like phospholipase/acyl hydrolase